MPREFDSDVPDARLCFSETVCCPGCGTEFEAVFVGDAMSVQDITDAPRGNHVCPGCGCRFVSSMSGWIFYGEAG